MKLSRVKRVSASVQTLQSRAARSESNAFSKVIDNQDVSAQYKPAFSTAE